MDQGVYGHDVVDLLHLHIEARRERIALAGVSELRQAGDALCALEGLVFADVGDTADANVIEEAAPQRSDVSLFRFVPEVDMEQRGLACLDLLEVVERKPGQADQTRHEEQQCHRAEGGCRAA